MLAFGIATLPPTWMFSVLRSMRMSGEITTRAAGMSAARKFSPLIVAFAGAVGPMPPEPDSVSVPSPDFSVPSSAKCSESAARTLISPSCSLSPAFGTSVANSLSASEPPSFGAAVVPANV